MIISHSLSIAGHLVLHLGSQGFGVHHLLIELCGRGTRFARIWHSSIFPGSEENRILFSWGPATTVPFPRISGIDLARGEADVLLKMLATVTKPSLDWWSQTGPSGHLETLF